MRWLIGSLAVLALALLVAPSDAAVVRRNNQVRVNVNLVQAAPAQQVVVQQQIVRHQRQGLLQNLQDRRQAQVQLRIARLQTHALTTYNYTTVPAPANIVVQQQAYYQPQALLVQPRALYVQPQQVLVAPQPLYVQPQQLVQPQLPVQPQREVLPAPQSNCPCEAPQQAFAAPSYYRVAPTLLVAPSRRVFLSTCY